jgi:hypothetical protein
MLIDDAIPRDRNVIKKEAEKILKYHDLIIEIQRVWNVQARVIPEPSQNRSENTQANYQENTKLRNYKKQRYWALHTYCLKC